VTVKFSDRDRNTEETSMKAACPKMSFFGNQPDLSLANHVNRLDTLNRSPRRVIRPETLTRSHPAFDRPMILFYDIVEKANRSTAAAPAQFSRPFEFIDHLRIGRIAVYVDDPWPRVLGDRKAL
jgi:hypothetical protein